MIDLISSAAGKFDDPLILEWAVSYYDHLGKQAREARARIESAWFHDLAIARLIDRNEFHALTRLFRVLPPEHLTNLTQRILDHWRDWPGSLAGRAVPALAAHASAALFDLLEEYLGRVERGSAIDPDRFRTLPCLRLAGFRERRMALLERLARCLLALPPADFARDFLLSKLLSQADALQPETLESVLAGGLRTEGPDRARQSQFNQLFQGLFGGSEFLDLVFARAGAEASQGLLALAPLFSPEAPLEQWDAWLDTPPPLTEVLSTLAAAGSFAHGAEVLHRLLNGTALKGLLAGNESVLLALAGCIHSHVVADLDTAVLDLPATIDLLAADLDNPRWAEALRARLAAFPRAETAPRLIERLPAVSRTYGSIQIASAMGSLGCAEFVPPLIESIGDDQPDFLCTAAMKALASIGAAARDALIASWDDLDRSQRIYAFSVIGKVGGQAAAEFALARFDSLLADDEESFCELVLAAPDHRLLDRLRPELRRRQVLIDRAYAILACLLEQEDDDSRAAHDRAVAEQARIAQVTGSLLSGELPVSDSLILSLTCPECDGVNDYEVAGVILPSQGHGDLPYLVEDEFPCASCGAWVEFEFTSKAILALTARAVLMRAMGENGRKDDDQPRPMRLADCRINGRTMPIAAGLKLLRERVARNAEDGGAWYLLGVSYSNINRPRAALIAFEKAAAALPTTVTVTLRHAELLAEAGRLEDALNLLVAAWPRRHEWQFFGDPSTVQREFMDLYNRLRRQLGRADLPALHPATIGESRKVGRNDPCPCGSGKKFKKCCGK